MNTTLLVLLIGGWSTAATIAVAAWRNRRHP